MPHIIITIPGKPVSKKRPRFVRRGNFVHSYNPQETEEGRWILVARQQIQEKIPEGVAISLQCFFYLPIPKGTSRKKRESLFYHTKKPDLSNCLKFVEDCLTGELWYDDSQIARVTAMKMYSEDPRTDIEVEWGCGF